MADGTLKVDKNSPIPVYYQIETDLKKRIMRQEWDIGEQLPGELDLARHYDVSRITLRQALAELEKDGIIRKERGKGSFLAADPTPYVNSLNYAVVSKGRLFSQPGGPAVTAKILEQRLVTDLFPAVSEHLELEREGWAVYIKRLYLIGGRPIAISRSHLPAPLVPGMEGLELVRGSVLETLEQAYGLSADRVRTASRRCGPPPPTARCCAASRTPPWCCCGAPPTWPTGGRWSTPAPSGRGTRCASSSPCSTGSGASTSRSKQQGPAGSGGAFSCRPYLQ